MTVIRIFLISSLFILLASNCSQADYLPDAPSDSYSINVQEAVKDPLTDLQCMALNIYHEARGEPLLGQYAVAMVTLNRVRSPHYPDSICEVILQPWQFSWTNDNLPDQPYEDQAWKLSYNIAYRFLVGDFRVDWMSTLTHYHDLVTVVDWKGVRVVMMLGNHVYYEPCRANVCIHLQ